MGIDELKYLEEFHRERCRFGSLSFVGMRTGSLLFYIYLESHAVDDKFKVV